MLLLKRKIIIDTENIFGSAIPFAKFQVRSRGDIIADGKFIPQINETLTAGANGRLEVEIYTIENYFVPYELKCLSADNTNKYEFDLPPGADIYLDVLISLSTVPETLPFSLQLLTVLLAVVQTAIGDNPASGPAGGVLSGHYPNPDFAVNMVEQSEFDAQIDVVEGSIEDLENDLEDLQIDLAAHESATNNPHNVTKAQVNLGNVDNTSDLNKPVSTAQATADAAATVSAITAIRNGVASEGDDLAKLLAKINAQSAIIGGSTADGDALVNTVAELLAVFATYPEGIDLVQALGDKVNVSAIVNNLTEITSGKVLDAQQGKQLKDLIDLLATGKEAAIAAGTNLQYWRGNKTWRDFATDVRGAVLTGIVFTTNSAITLTDSVLIAFGKLQAQINAIKTFLVTTGDGQSFLANDGTYKAVSGGGASGTQVTDLAGRAQYSNLTASDAGKLIKVLGNINVDALSGAHPVGWWVDILCEEVAHSDLRFSGASTEQSVSVTKSGVTVTENGFFIVTFPLGVSKLIKTGAYSYLLYQIEEKTLSITATPYYIVPLGASGSTLFFRDNSPANAAVGDSMPIGWNVYVQGTGAGGFFRLYDAASSPPTKTLYRGATITTFTDIIIISLSATEAQSFQMRKISATEYQIID